MEARAVVLMVRVIARQQLDGKEPIVTFHAPARRSVPRVLSRAIVPMVPRATASLVHATALWDGRGTRAPNHATAQCMDPDVSLLVDARMERHHVIGSRVCACTAGSYGDKCQIACPSGKFGPGCIQSCSCNN
eukprot:Opistho-2@66129